MSRSEEILVEYAKINKVAENNSNQLDVSDICALQIATSLIGINGTLAMFYDKMYPETNKKED